jgi:hypothetical protein
MISAIVTVLLTKEYKRQDPIVLMVLDKVSQPVIMHNNGASRLVTPGAHGNPPKTVMRDMYVGVEVSASGPDEIYTPVNGQPYFFLPEQITNVDQVSFIQK